jgi:hypothetical protein
MIETQEPESVTHERDGSTTLIVRVPPTPEQTRSLDAAYQRLQDWCGVGRSDWYFTSLSEPSHSYGYICVLEKKAITHSMSGSSGLAAAVAGFGASWQLAIDHALTLAKAHDAEHGRREETPGYVHVDDD